MAHQLYVLQTLSLSLLEQRMNSKMDPQDQDAHEKIKVLFLWILLEPSVFLSIAAKRLQFHYTDGSISF